MRQFIILIYIRIFNISIDTFSLDFLSLLLSHLAQKVERTNILFHMYEILGFLNLVYFTHLLQKFSHLYIELLDMR